MHKLPPMAFHYAIKFPDGLWYYGSSIVGSGKDAKRIANPSNRGPVAHTYTYTERGAYNVISTGGPGFSGCTVHRVLG